MKVTDDNKCTLCRNEVDYIEHFFYECPPVKTFWGKTEHFIQGKIGKHIELTVCDVLFGVQNKDHGEENLKTINTVILVGKMCISIAKKTKSVSPLFLIFEQQISYRWQ